MAITHVDLVLWDPTSPQHVQELHNQRIQCGWDADLVSKWQAAQVEGTKCIYWIVIPSSSLEANDLVGQHLAKHPKTKGPLSDSATSVGGKHVEPTARQFQPVGHIGLDTHNPSAEYLDLDLPKDHCFWITTFYVSTALQSQGLGRAAMDQIESLATREPLCARTLMLDTLKDEDQNNEEIARGYFGGPPKVTNQKWYARRGYRLIKTELNYYKQPDCFGRQLNRHTVFMRRDLDC